MMIIKRLIVSIAGLLFIVIMTTGCSNVTGKNEFLETTKLISESADREDWEQLNKLSIKIVDQYHKNKWKIQLIGDEGEYEGLEEYINQLITAIELKSKEETKLALSGVKTIIEDIYSL